jgi:hypothetical protein
MDVNEVEIGSRDIDSICWWLIAPRFDAISPENKENYSECGFWTMLLKSGALQTYNNNVLFLYDVLSAV